MNLQRKKMKAFTLLEILIASGIFAVVMVMTTGIVIRTSGYQTRIAAGRSVSGETNRIASILTEEIQSANNSGFVTYDFGLTKQYPHGMAFFNCTKIGGSADCSVVDNTKPASSTTLTANTLVLFQKTVEPAYLAKIYYSTTISSNKNVYFTQIEISTPTTAVDLPSNIITMTGGTGVDYLLSRPSNGITNDTSILFGGYAPDSVSYSKLGITPYASFDVMTKTRDFQNKLPTERAISDVFSTVATRNYVN